MHRGRRGVNVGRLLRLECGGSLLRLLDVVERVERGVGMAIRATSTIGPGKVLSVVDSEVDVVEGVVCGAVDDLLKRVSRYHVRVVNLERESATTF